MTEQAPVHIWDLDTGEEITDRNNTLQDLGKFVATGGSLRGVPVLVRVVMSGGPEHSVLVNAQFEITSTIPITEHTTIERVEFIINNQLLAWDSTQHAVRPGDTFSITPRITIS
jgi:hypothetical protein